MRSLLIVPLLLTGLASAQVDLPPDPSYLAIATYLELTDAQLTGIERLNRQLESYRAGKAGRQFVVQQELAEQMLRDPLDPTAIGLRHVELESIRRETEAEQTKTTFAIRALLTPVQRARLEDLSQVLRQHSLACLALGLNLISPLPLRPRLTVGGFLPGSLLWFPTDDGCSPSAANFNVPLTPRSTASTPSSAR
jgi:hypothetical protein